MEHQKGFRSLSKTHQYLLIDIFIVFFGMGTYMTLIGAELPLIKEEYQISYQISGLMMSAQSIGCLLSGAFISIPARFLGAKKTYLIFVNLTFLGLLMIMASGNPVLLIIAMLFTGISKGCGCYFGNQMTNNISNDDAGLQNLIQAFFAIGACFAPLLAMICGASWRLTLGITVAIGVVGLLHGLKLKIGPKEYSAVTQQSSGKNPWAFMKTKIFWMCSSILFCYLAVEAAVMGWLVTYFIDTGAANESTAQLLATLLWAALLIGRFICAWVAKYFKPYQMIAVMTAGVTVCFTALMMSNTLLTISLSAMGLGLFLAGMYGTAVAGSDGLVEKYPLCMGMFIAIPGIGAIVSPSMIGTIADRIGIRLGMSVLYVFIIVLIVVTVWYAVYMRKKNPSR